MSMGVYIKGMKMPESPVLFCVHPDGKVFADLEGGWREYKAIPVPPHGDLIDRDALPWEKQSLMAADEDWALPCVIIEDAPAIIPAEEGAT